MTRMNAFYFETTFGGLIHGKNKSAESLNPCKSVIQTINDIIKAHGGQLDIKTEEGNGSVFVISLPAV